MDLNHVKRKWRNYRTSGCENNGAMIGDCRVIDGGRSQLEGAYILSQKDLTTWVVYIGEGLPDGDYE